MPLPDVVIIGAQKSGTTWLARMLDRHPRIRIPTGERHFFTDPDRWERGVEWYKSQIPERPRPDVIVGEKTANYLWSERPAHVTERMSNSPARMRQVIPEAKLIAVLRDPVERAISAYNHFLRSGRIPPWRGVSEVLTGDHRDLGEAYGMLSMGLYGRQLRQFMKYYPREQILILIFERDVVEDPRQGLEKACEFLGVPCDIEGNSEVRFNAPRRSWASVWIDYFVGRPTRVTRRLNRILGPMDKRRPDEAGLDRLREYFRSDVRELEEMLGIELPEWRDRRQLTRDSSGSSRR